MESQQGVPGSKTEDRPEQDPSTRKDRGIDLSIWLTPKDTRA